MTLKKEKEKKKKERLRVRKSLLGIGEERRETTPVLGLYLDIPSIYACVFKMALGFQVFCW